MRWLEIAWREINSGVAEVPGPESHPRIIEYFRVMGHPHITSDATAWCAAATGYCLHQAGVDLSALPKGLELRARSYLRLGTPIDQPRVGAIAVLSRDVSGDPGAGHVGIIAGVTATHIMLASGNQANAFNVTAFPRGRVVGYRWPVVISADEVAHTSRIAGASQRQIQDVARIAGSQATAQVIPPSPPGLGQAAAVATETMGAIEVLTAFAVFAWSKLPILIVVAGLFWLGRMAWDAYHVRQWRAEDAATGKTIAASTDETVEQMQ